VTEGERLYLMLGCVVRRSGAASRLLAFRFSERACGMEAECREMFFFVKFGVPGIAVLIHVLR
jgi:hypothetical protein